MTGGGKRVRGRRRRTRAAVLLEFVFTLPLSLAMCMFIVDAGRVFIATGAMNDAAWQVARQAAVHGSYSQTTAEDTFYGALQAPAGVKLEKGTAAVVAVQGTCDNSKPETRTIRVTATAAVPSLTPGATLLLGGGTMSGWKIAVSAVARCETYP